MDRRRGIDAASSRPPSSTQGQALTLTDRNGSVHTLNYDVLGRMDATNKRFLAAVRTLALVRKLAVPALQVNIARRQVNVVAPSAVN